MTKDSLPSQSTTLEALLRGEGLDRRNSSKNDEESLLEIQVRPEHPPRRSNEGDRPPPTPGSLPERAAPANFIRMTCRAH